MKTTVEYRVGDQPKSRLEIDSSQLVLAGNGPQCLIRLPHLSPGEVLFYLYQDHRGLDVAPGPTRTGLWLNGQALTQRTRLKEGDGLRSPGFTLELRALQLPEASPTAVWDSNRGIRPVTEDAVVDSLLSTTRESAPPRESTSLDAMIPKELMEAGLSGQNVPSFKMEFHKDTPVKRPATPAAAMSLPAGMVPCSRCSQAFEGTRAQVHWYEFGGDRSTLVCLRCKEKDRLEAFRSSFSPSGFNIEAVLDDDPGPGRVFKATNAQGRLVLLRVIETAFFGSRVREADVERGLKALRDGIIDHGYVPALVECRYNSEFILVSETWVEGRSLSQISAQQRLSCSQFIPILCRVLEVLIVSHRQGVYHGCLSEDWVTYSVEGREAKIFVRGFGLLGFQYCRDLGGQMRPFQHISPVLLPTLLEEDGFEAQADLYHLGWMSFKLMAGIAPFEDNGLAELSRQLNEENPKALAELCPEIPKPFSDYVSWLLNRSLEDRPKSAREALTRLLELNLI